ncbi:RCC1/BLIP-II protein [Cutaneotrichosporon oleaginosum]|uniref:RCC1/BLIP-II protein n=1 Tax=Cutaneotrichosporon oleaginosum TaxID=879819 RepID=A0A0J0XKT8_9TREE|nr:RCC1/BLIP-II protein [Cutaneotrichosporon oleaginosum]KLT41743.1 RCC1/BLIP-II protein [Cutaneotrichosporon oleaginosum]
MPNLHAHYYHGNVKAFRQELDGASPAANGARQSSSGGRSWTLSGFVPKADPNERDALGRTVLHLASASNTPQAYQFFQILLRNPALSVNLQDYESGYTALHRALYSGNLRAARDLLARPDIDLSVTDNEGLTAFDLFNGTVEGTNPPDIDGDVVGTDLYVWGVNRNSTLGLGDASADKAFPDRVNLLTQRQASDNPDPAERFFHVGVRDVQMAKLHTGVVTAEARGNISLCGFGSAGRLGQKTHSQLPLIPLPDFPHTVIALALGPDHTLALTSGGYVMTWGSNRYSQLGYTIEAPANPSPFAKDDELIVQTTPKRIVGPLKKEWVRGVAAGRMSSACWTADAVWTWGTNLGHLGYEKAANPTQINPRKVTAISQPVIDVALSDYAMLCLLDSNEVLCFHHDTHFKVNFSSPQKPLKGPKNPGHVSMDPTIVKVTSCGQTFATLSAKGDVCTFTLPHPSEEATKDVRDRHVIVKPQILWALRKSFTAVKDLALGPDGTVIVCTKSGHVFVRQRTKGGSGALKFRRIPYLQRIIKVAANETGGFAAIRADARPSPIALKGKTLEEDMFSLQPHIRRYESQMTAADFDGPVVRRNTEDEEDEGSNSVHHDIVVATQLCRILDRWQGHNSDSLFAWSEPLLGSDVSITVGEYVIPAHSVVLCLRTAVFARVLSGQAVEGLKLAAEDGRPAIQMDACHPLVALLLLQYLYSDEMAAVWDSRVVFALQTKFPNMTLPIVDIKRDIRRFVDVLELAPLKPVLELASKTAISTKTLPSDLATFFAQSSTPPSEVCDIVVVLADREVSVNSALLRARCPFFEAMFADRDWTLRREHDGKVIVNMEHLRWRPMRLVFRFIHEGLEDDLFDYLHQETLDEFLDFVFEVLAAATELLMDRLVLVCSRVIAKHCNPFNAAALAVEASFYRAAALRTSIFDYISACMETMLESGLLDDMDDDVLRELSKTVAVKQGDKAVVPRSNILVDELMVKHRECAACAAGI